MFTVHGGACRNICGAVLALVASVSLLADAAAREDRPGEQTHAKETRAKATRIGLASYYGKGLEGRKTASGEVFDKTEMVAAHPSHPLGTRARVTNLRNGRSQEVRIIDRGPAIRHQSRGVIIDVSQAVATQLGFRKKGKTKVKVEVLEWGRKEDG